MKKVALLVCVIASLLAGIGAFFLRPQPQPEYGWFVFGPEGHVRLLVTLHGEAVTLDHYTDGQATGRTDRFANRQACKDVTITDPDGQTTYTINRMGGTVVTPGEATELFVDVAVQGAVRYQQYCDLFLKADATSARVAHFHGPLTIEVKKINWQVHPRLKLRRGDQPTELQANIGTMNAEKGCWVVVRTHGRDDQPEFPKGVHPVVDVEFPSRNAADPPIKRRFPLEQFC